MWRNTETALEACDLHLARHYAQHVYKLIPVNSDFGYAQMVSKNLSSHTNIDFCQAWEYESLLDRQMIND